MGFGFGSLEHGLAAVGHDIVVGARAVAAATGKVSDAAPAIEAVTGMLDPPAVIVERAAFSALAYVAKAANDTSAVTQDKGLNVQLDEQTIADFKEVYRILSQQLAALSKSESAAVEAAERVQEPARTAGAKT